MATCKHQGNREISTNEILTMVLLTHAHTSSAQTGQDKLSVLTCVGVIHSDIFVFMGSDNDGQGRVTRNLVDLSIWGTICEIKIDKLCKPNG